MDTRLTIHENYRDPDNQGESIQLNHEEQERVRSFPLFDWHIGIGYHFLLDIMSQIHPLPIIWF